MVLQSVYTTAGSRALHTMWVSGAHQGNQGHMSRTPTPTHRTTEPAQLLCMTLTHLPGGLPNTLLVDQMPEYTAPAGKKHQQGQGAWGEAAVGGGPDA
jgi:hypothetical protein